MLFPFLLFCDELLELALNSCEILTPICHLLDKQGGSILSTQLSLPTSLLSFMLLSPCFI